MKQKLQDLILLIKQEKKYQVAAALGAICVMYLMVADPARTPRAKKQQPREVSSLSNQREAYDDLMSAMKSDLTAVSEGVKQNTRDLAELKVAQDKDRQRVAEIFKKMLDRLADVQATSASMSGGGGVGPQMLPEGDIPAAQGMPAAAGMGGAPDGSMGGSSMPGAAGGGVYGAGATTAALGGNLSGGNLSGGNAELASWGGAPSAVVPPAPPPPKKVAVIAPGDSVRVKLLAGVNAPTDGTPYPVVFKLVDDVHGPDSSSLPLGEARLVAAAQGSLADQRALFRLTTLNIRLSDGRKKIVPCDGWVVGEDGIRGMEGILIDPIGKAIAGTAEAGFISGLGEGFAASQTSTSNGFYGPETSITGDPAIYAAGKGAAGAANALSGIIKDRIKLLVPHVKVFSGREATAVFSKPINITDLYESLENGDTSFAGSVD